jgi:ABC-2 type transport system permease protein
MKTAATAFVGEYRRIFSDKGALLILVGGLVLYAFFYPMPYVHEVLKEVPVAVVDLDQSVLSRQLTRMLDADELIRVAGQPTSVAQAERLAREGTANGIVVVPEGFERQIRRGEQAAVVSYADASYFLMYRQMLTGAMEATGTLSAGIEIRRLQAQGFPADAAMNARDPLPLVMRPLFNPIEGYGSYIVPAVLVLILQQTLLVGIGLIGGTAQERPAGPPEPSSRGVFPSFQTLVGRVLAYFLLYLVHLLFYFGVVFHVFGFAQRGHALALFAFGTPFLLAVILLGLTARTVFSTREMSMQVLLFTSMPSLFLAGFSWPVESLPRWMAAAAQALPSTSAIAGFLRISQMGSSLAQVRHEWLVLWALCAIYGVTAWIAEARTQRRT